MKAQEMIEKLNKISNRVVGSDVTEMFSKTQRRTWKKQNLTESEVAECKEIYEEMKKIESELDLSDEYQAFMNMTEMFEF